MKTFYEIRRALAFAVVAVAVWIASVVFGVEFAGQLKAVPPK